MGNQYNSPVALALQAALDATLQVFPEESRSAYPQARPSQPPFSLPQTDQPNDEDPIKRDLLRMLQQQSQPAGTKTVPANGSAEDASWGLSEDEFNRLNQAAYQPYNRNGWDSLSTEQLLAMQEMLEDRLPDTKEFAQMGTMRDARNYSMRNTKYGTSVWDINTSRTLTPIQRREILRDSLLSFPYDNPFTASLDQWQYFSFDNLKRYWEIKERNYEPVRAMEDELENIKQMVYFAQRKAEFDALPQESKEAIWKAAQMRSELEQDQHRTPLFIKSSLPINMAVQGVKGTPFKLIQCIMEEQKAKSQPGYNKNLYEYVKLLANVETTETNQQKDVELAEKNPWLSTYKSIVEKPGAAVDSLVGTTKTNLHNWTSGDSMPVDLNDAYHANNQSIKVSRETVAEKIREVTGVEMLGDAYTIGVSVADGLLVAPLSTISPVIPAVILGTEAAADTSEDIVRRGGSAEQAMLGGVISFTANTAFNLFSFGDLQALSQASVSGLKNILSNLVKSAFVNITEDSLSWAVDQLADQIVMGDLSRYNQAVQGYMQNGLSREAAERQAGWDMARDLSQTVIQSGVRGIAFSAGGMAYGARNKKVQSSARSSYDVNDMASRAANGQIAGGDGSKTDVSVSDGDMELARILHEDAPRKPFTDVVDGGIMEGDEAQYFEPSSGKTGMNQVLWDSWKNYPKVEMDGHQYAKVGDRLYSKHAVERMQPSGNRFGPNIYQGINGSTYGRSISPQYVEYIISTTKPQPQDNGNLLYKSGTVKVFTNQQGAVVTIMTYQ